MTDLIAVRLRSTALAGLPLLVLFTVPITMNAQHESFGTAVVFCLGTAGYLAMLSADGRERIRVWGRLVSLWRSGSLYESATGRSRRGPTTRVPRVARRGADESGAPDQRTGARPGHPGAGRGGPAGGARVGHPRAVRAAARARPAPEQAVLLGPGHRRQRRHRTGAGLSLPDTLSQTLRELQARKPDHVLTYTAPTAEQETRRTSRPTCTTT